MHTKPLRLLLADDDEDDCLLFLDALGELPIYAKLDIVYDGIELMDFLRKNFKQLPQALFLDLNMPRKNGFECLEEIKNDKHLKKLPVIIISTSHDMKMINQLYRGGAQHYIHKPAEFDKLKELLRHAIDITVREKSVQPAKEYFVLASN